MNIVITARKFELTQDVEEYVNEKVGRLERVLPDSPTLAKVILTVDDGHHRHGDVNGCEILIHIKGKDLRVEEWTGDMFSAIDLAADKMKHHGEHSDRGSKVGGLKAVLKGVWRKRG